MNQHEEDQRGSSEEEEEEEEEEEVAQSATTGRSASGRPVGKKAAVGSAAVGSAAVGSAAVSLASAAAKKRGRPRGSKNKDKDVEAVAKFLLGAAEAPVSKRVRSLQEHEAKRARLLVLHNKLTGFLHDSVQLLNKEALILNHMRANGLLLIGVDTENAIAAASNAALFAASQSLPAPSASHPGMAPEASSSSSSALAPGLAEPGSLPPQGASLAPGSAAASAQLLEAYNAAALLQAAEHQPFDGAAAGSASSS